MAASSRAASATLRAIGPALSWLKEIGMMPSRLTSPTVGLSPTMPLTAAGQTMLPSVSVPMATTAKLAATATALPELEPQGLRFSAYGLRVCPPTALQPEVDWVERKLAHSLRFVLPRITAPASRRRCTRKASRPGRKSFSASEPAVLCIGVAAMLSFSSTGMPCSRPRTRPARRSASRWAASRRASGFSSITARRVGPLRSSSAMRRR